MFELLNLCLLRRLASYLLVIYGHWVNVAGVENFMLAKYLLVTYNQAVNFATAVKM